MVVILTGLRLAVLVQPLANCGVMVGVVLSAGGHIGRQPVDVILVLAGIYRLQFSQFTVQKKNILILPKTAAGVLSPVILTGICFLLLFLTCGQILWNRIPPPTLQRTIFCEWGGISPKTFQFTTDIFSEKNRGLLENKNAPGLGKSGSIVICGYEISENSKHSRCPYTAAK